jgi:uncharacterized protein YbjT (DUF2867 family)
MNEINMKEIKVILTGATGMIGDGVLLECLENPNVKEVVAIGRRECGRKDSKLKEIIHPDMYDISPVADKLIGYDACFFCLGASSVGKTEEEYTKITHTLALNFAKVLVSKNPEMTFCFISGAATDSTEKGKIMWARVKGKTENDLMKLPFKRVYNFRPGFILASKGQNNVHLAYKFVNWLYPVARSVFPKHVSTMKEVANAMIKSVTQGYEKQILEIEDMKLLANWN